MSKKVEKKNSKSIYPKSFDSKKYPDFIRKSVFLKAWPKPVKAFPKIGLTNCEQALSTVRITGKALYLHQLEQLRDALSNIEATAKTVENDAYFDFTNDVEELSNQLDDDICNRYDVDSYMPTINGKCTLILPQSNFTFSGMGKSVKLGKNPLISDLVSAMISFCKENKIDADSLKNLNFKKASISASEIAPWKKKNLKVCFSSDNEKGYWDIATMSMRKIQSCMNWKNGNSRSLVGSILDPYTAVIYITDGTNTTHGKTMLARSVVRFVVKGSGKDAKPYIMLENPYPRGIDRNVTKIFQSFIEQRVTLPVVAAEEDDYDSYYTIPTSEPVAAILELDEYDDSGFLSYRDSGIDYKEVPKFYNPEKIKSFARR